MPLYADNLLDEVSSRPIEGAQVYVYNLAGTVEASIQDELGVPVVQPLLTGPDGDFAFQVATGQYQLVFWKDARRIFRDRHVIIGTPAVTELAVGTFGSTLVASDTAAQARTDLGINSAAELAAAGGGALIGNQLPEGENLRTQSLAEFIEENPIQPSQFAGTPEQQLTRAVIEAGTARSSALGGKVTIPRGVTTVATSFNMNNRAMIVGLNKRGSIIRANAAHAGPSMLTVINGATSTFDNRIQELTLDCNDVAGLSGIISSAWQEGGGIRDCLIQKFRGVGLDIVDTIGGVSQLLIENSEFFGSASGATACIRFDDPSLVSSCVLMITNSAFTGGAPVLVDSDPGRAAARASMPVAIDIVNGSSASVGAHIEVAERGFRLDGNGRHVIIGAKGSSPNGLVNAGVETLVEIAATFTGTLIMIGCSRNGAAHLVKDLRANGLGTISYDCDVSIRPDRPVEQGAIMASAVINGSGTPAVTSGFGILSITDNGTGDYTVALTRSAQNTNDIAWFASANSPGVVRVDNNGVNSCRIYTFNAAGAATDVNQIKLLAVRLK